MDEYFQQSLVNLAKLIEPQSENNLVLELTSAYLFNSCGYRLLNSSVDPKELAETIRKNPRYLLECTSIAQKKINNILN